MQGEREVKEMHPVSKGVNDEPWLRGHFGLTKTLGKLSKKYFGKNAEKEVEKYVGSCCACLERKKVGDQARLQPAIVQGLSEKIRIDVVDPLEDPCAVGCRAYTIICCEVYVQKQMLTLVRFFLGWDDVVTRSNCVWSGWRVIQPASVPSTVIVRELGLLLMPYIHTIIRDQLHKREMTGAAKGDAVSKARVCGMFIPFGAMCEKSRRYAAKVAIGRLAPVEPPENTRDVPENSGAIRANVSLGRSEDRSSARVTSMRYNLDQKNPGSFDATRPKRLISILQAHIKHQLTSRGRRGALNVGRCVRTSAGGDVPEGQFLAHSSSRTDHLSLDRLVTIFK
ncbi:hypothetical protein EVAR_3873_1 [Eumeta japonica]|uniref:Integrase zinc-binding domain-containing protein n=1 Tax=Eumeta variegata TaxID=151549 RepID=A0A4C1SR80_EUMVA|nr:hypothetical protein EVAR_3873_1 [Eumeta japonica]